jgi:transcription antitermination factor NusG
VDVDLPLFPGYVFSQFAVDRRLPILTIPGVLHVVGFGKTPEPIDDVEMSSLQALVRSHAEVHPWPDQFVGHRVRLTGGSLAGVEGTLTSVKGNHRIVVTISLLQRSVAVEIPADFAWPSDPSVVLLSAF